MSRSERWVEATYMLDTLWMGSLGHSACGRCLVRSEAQTRCDHELGLVMDVFPILDVLRAMSWAWRFAC